MPFNISGSQILRGEKNTKASDYEIRGGEKKKCARRQRCELRVTRDLQEAIRGVDEYIGKPTQYWVWLIEKFLPRLNTKTSAIEMWSQDIWNTRYRFYFFPTRFHEITDNSSWTGRIFLPFWRSKPHMENLAAVDMFLHTESPPPWKPNRVIHRFWSNCVIPVWCEPAFQTTNTARRLQCRQLHRRTLPSVSLYQNHSV